MTSRTLKGYLCLFLILGLSLYSLSTRIKANGPQIEVKRYWLWDETQRDIAVHARAGWKVSQFDIDKTYYYVIYEK